MTLEHIMMLLHHQAKIMCGAMCKCVGCKNCEENYAAPGVSLMSLADAAMVRTVHQSSVSTSDRLSQPIRAGAASLAGTAPRSSRYVNTGDSREAANLLWRNQKLEGLQR